jgi:heme-degrading monooxygenase HmoA
MWRGTVRTEDSGRYCAYIQETGISHYKSTSGNLGAWLLTNPIGELTEVVTLSFWESEAAIRAFAGDDISVARFYPEDEQYLVDWGNEVHHYQVDSPGRNQPN